MKAENFYIIILLVNWTRGGALSIAQSRNNTTKYAWADVAASTQALHMRNSIDKYKKELEKI